MIDNSHTPLQWAATWRLHYASCSVVEMLPPLSCWKAEGGYSDLIFIVQAHEPSSGVFVYRRTFDNRGTASPTLGSTHLYQVHSYTDGLL